MSDKITYVKHPITQKQKAELRAEGARIVDAKFAPDGAEIIDMGGAEPEIAIPGSPEDIDKLKKPELETLLKKHGVENPTGNVPDLKEALKKVMFVGE